MSRATIQLLCAAGAVVLAIALQFSNGHFDPGALLLATVSAACAIRAAVLGVRPGGPPEGADAGRAARRERSTRVVLAVGIAAGLGCHLFAAPGRHVDPQRLAPFRALAAAAALVALTYLRRVPVRIARFRFGLLVALHLAMGAAMIRASPAPYIDVWVFQQQGARALAAGRNPYSIDYPNLYPNDGRSYHSSFVVNGRVVVYPYPPLTALLGVPAVRLLGDVRYALLACVALAAWMVRRLGAGVVAELAALVLLFQPRSFFVLEQAWTEPIVLAAWAASLVAVSRWRATDATAGAGTGRRPLALATGLASGVLAASKQYAPLFLVPLAMALPRRGRWLAVATGAAVALATIVPFAVWDARELYRDVVVMQFLQPFRLDSLSWLALWGRIAGTRRVPVLPAFVASGLALVRTLPRRASAAQAALVAPAAFLPLLLLNKQAFANYYWLAVGLSLAGCALASSGGSVDQSPAR